MLLVTGEGGRRHRGGREGKSIAGGRFPPSSGDGDPVVQVLLVLLLCCMQAKVTQQANMMAGKRSAPIWALAAIMFLGWNEFMAVLWNPVLLIVGLVTFVFGYQMYNELDVDAELQRGLIPGALKIWGKMGDVVMAVSCTALPGLLLKSGAPL